jgi:AcrR family transcriptional regulator
MDRQRSHRAATFVTGERTNQKLRTRQAILRAAGKLIARGKRPNLDEIAAQAGVSRATAYRYFPGFDSLLDEAVVDVLVPDPGCLFDEAAPLDPFERLKLVDDVIDGACRRQEVPLRLMLSRVLHRTANEQPDTTPLRQNRREPLIGAALSEVKAEIGEAQFERLSHALSMIIGAEGFLALNDVVGLEENEAREVRRWAMKVLVAAAVSEASGT